MPTALTPSFDLVVATVDRATALAAFLQSVAEQDVGAVRVVVVDQNPDDRLVDVIDAAPALSVEHLRAPRGLSRARNVALPRLAADLVAFPDDDCVYPPGLLARVADRFASEPALDGLTGREVAPDASSSPSWERTAAILTDRNLWNRAISFTIFLRRETLEAVGAFDERLGLGAGDGPWESGEETDLLIRAVRGGARIAYDPTLEVVHAVKPSDAVRRRALARRDGASIGYLLRKHSYPATTIGRMLTRPVGGAALALLRGDPHRAMVHVETLRGRATGLRRARRSD